MKKKGFTPLEMRRLPRGNLSLTGFTLIELIIIIALFSILAAAIFWTFVAGLRAWGSGRDRAYIRQDANLAIERMVRELSEASEINTAGSDEIEFDADLDGDGSVETIRFDVSNDDNLERTEVITGPDIIVTLARNVQTFTLGYYLDGDNDTLLSSVTGPSRDDVRVIVISLTLNEGGETLTLSSSVYTRNQGL
jgi:type II secretory pathway pseudopilin PulG